MLPATERQRRAGEGRGVSMAEQVDQETKKNKEMMLLLLLETEMLNFKFNSKFTTKKVDFKIHHFIPNSIQNQR